MSDTAPTSSLILRESFAMVFAYLDPTVSTVVIQTVVAAAITVPIVLRTQVAALIARLRGLKGTGPAVEVDEGASKD